MYDNAEQSYTDRQDRFFVTASQAENHTCRRAKSTRCSAATKNYGIPFDDT
jgi:hypothetical protein